ncbi:MAG: hypothetical protein ING72_10840 [Methylobacterium sp.]|nr:hypothetical protein [Methylobacterium sp.]MCA3604293.1 hypothetical protein [Methylobacterium sp.]MCA3616326.1 hypothetical protein [Methylobacterium sp.]MCA4910823.1 hypothetical protein [Methylobacterium sp.]
MGIMVRIVLLLALLAAPARAEQAEVRAADCTDLGRRFERLVAVYTDAASVIVNEMGDIPKALERARNRAVAGDVQATVPMTGLPWLLRSNAERYSVASVRQICTLAERNNHPLHIATCAYFTALNPLGEREQKRKLVANRIESFELLPAKARGGTNAPAHLWEDMAFLKTCLPPD